MSHSRKAKKKVVDKISSNSEVQKWREVKQASRTNLDDCKQNIVVPP